MLFDLGTVLGRKLEEVHLFTPAELELTSSLFEVAYDGLLPNDIESASQLQHVLQLSLLPATLNPSLYRNAFSNANPGGDRRASYAFRMLADPLPAFQCGYMPTSQSLENLYGTLLRSAVGASRFVQTLLGKAWRTFQSAEQASLTGSPSNTWRLVEASPSDWWDSSVADRFKKVTLDLSGGDSGGFIILDGDDVLKLNRNREVLTKGDSKTRVREVTFSCQVVSLARTWFDPLFFRIGGWTINGMGPGTISTGKSSTNNGLMPLVPEALIIGCDADVTADWGPEDSRAINASPQGSVFLGPFPIFPTQSGDMIKNMSTLFVVGVICTLMPFSPSS